MSSVVPQERSVCYRLSGGPSWVRGRDKPLFEQLSVTDWLPRLQFSCHLLE